MTRTRQILTMGALAIAMVAATAVTLVALNLGADLAQPTGDDSALLDSASPALAAGADGISASAAAELARSHVGESAVFVSAVEGKYRDVFNVLPAGTRTLDQPDRLVWAVTFDGEYEICPPNGAPCWTPRPGQTQVILDYLTGEFLESGTFAPAK